MTSPYEKIIPKVVYYGDQNQLEDIPQANLQMYDDLKVELLPDFLLNKNINEPQYTRGVSHIVPMASPTLGGLYRTAAPNTVYLNPVSRDPIKVLGHEAFHLQEDAYDKWLKEKKASGEIPKDVKTYHDLLGDKLVLKGQDKKTLKDLYALRYSTGGQFGDVPYETMADLQGVESTLPTGKTILDTELGKQMLPTKEMQRAYLMTSLPGMRRVLPYEPSAAEVINDKIKAAKEYFKEVKGSAGKALVDIFR